ncbi:MAG: NUDIX hydrolase [Candidatus Omnitrophica bacterium]|nr:NUDIX hydrolase [Candidatus Omnitrophota bacterium]
MYKTMPEISAGAVLYTKIVDRFKVILYSRKKGTQWCLPKGKLEKGETREDAAIREVKEETGLEGEIIEHLKDVYYTYIDSRRKLQLNKTVHYFLMKYIQGLICADDAGVEDVVWFDIEEAIEKVAFDNEKQTLRRAQSVLKQS